MKNILVIGFGSIGARHARLIADAGHRCVVVSRREQPGWPEVHSNLEDALAAAAFSHAVIANETSEHWSTAVQLRKLGYAGPLLIEKPVAACAPDPASLSSLLPDRTWVAYNLRFHPGLRWLRARVADQGLISFNIQAGQDLRSWRTNRALQESYSARRALGGGVLRDLSHELDYLSWIAGPWQSVAARGGHFGPLAIDSDDCWSIILSTRRCPVVSLQLDYYHQPGTRRIVVNTERETVSLDLIASRAEHSEGVEEWPLDRDASYEAQLRAFLVGVDAEHLCTLNEGIETMSLIAAVEEASSEKRWISR